MLGKNRIFGRIYAKKNFWAVDLEGAFLEFFLSSTYGSWFLLQYFLWFGNVIVNVASTSVLTKTLKDDDYDKKSYWRSFLWGRLWTQRSRSLFQIIRNTVSFEITYNIEKSLTEHYIFYLFPVDYLLKRLILKTLNMRYIELKKIKMLRASSIFAQDKN